jgi:uncharacterized membrane protein
VTSIPATKRDWLIPASLVLLSIVPAIGGTVRLNQLASGAEITPESARFFAAPLPVVLHIVMAMIYSVVGAFQFSPGIRRRHRRWHRSAGKLLVTCGFVVALSGLWMTLFYPWAPGDGLAVYLERLVAGSAMLASLVLALDGIWRRNFAAHGDWMIRAYAIGLGAGTQVLTHIPWFILAEGKPAGVPRAVMMGAGWAINAVVAEWIVRRGRAEPVARGMAMAQLG